MNEHSIEDKGSVIINISHSQTGSTAPPVPIVVLVNSPITITINPPPSRPEKKGGWLESLVHGTEKAGLEIAICVMTVSFLFTFVSYKLAHHTVAPTEPVSISPVVSVEHGRVEQPTTEGHLAEFR